MITYKKYFENLYIYKNKYTNYIQEKNQIQI